MHALAGIVGDAIPIARLVEASGSRDEALVDRLRAHDRLAAIEQPVSTGWAFREAHKIAGREIILTLRVAQGEHPGQHEQPLLPPIYVVVGLRSLAGIQVDDRPVESVGAQQRAELRRATPGSRRRVRGTLAPQPRSARQRRE